MEKNGNEGTTIYEVGFHIVPLIAEENVLAEVATMKSALEKAGGTFISEESPKSRPLAYPIAKKVAGKKHVFDKAYFGWLKFEMANDKVAEFKAALDGNEHILRFILVTTTKETPMTYSKLAAARSEEEGLAAEAKPVSPEELDKSIDQLVTG